jgi:cell division protein FtsL
MQVRGRHLVFAWTAVFLAAVAAIVVRTRSGFHTRRRVDSLETRIKALESTRNAIEDSVSILRSRPALSPRAEALGLHHPSDSTVLIIRVPVDH